MRALEPRFMFDAAGAATAAAADSQSQSATAQTAAPPPAAPHADAPAAPAPAAAAEPAAPAAAPAPPAPAPTDTTAGRFTAGPAAADGGPSFTAKGNGYDVTASGAGLDVSLKTGGATADLGMSWAGGSTTVKPVAETAPADPVLAAEIPAAPGQAGYGDVRFSNIYQGVDLVVYGNTDHTIEYDLTVAPGADAGKIALQFTGAKSLSVDSSGNLDITLDGAEVVEHAPVAYQMVNGQRVGVDAAFDLKADGTVGFTLGYYDTSRELYIDPIITSNGGGASAALSVAENTSAVTTVHGTGVGNITYSVVGGADQADFYIDSGSGALTFITPPDFEAPTDVGHNNVYDVVVQAYDDNDASVLNQTLAVTVTNVNEAPTLGPNFNTSGSVYDNATIHPFDVVTVDDPDVGDHVSVRIAFDSHNGTLSGTGLTGSAGNYTLTATDPTTATARLQALVFTPTANQVAPNDIVQTNFTLTPNDGALDGTPDSTTTIYATSVNDAPTITGTVAAVQPVTDQTTITPFAAVTIGDVDSLAHPQAESVLVHVDDDGAGSFTTLNGFHNDGGGDYSFNGTAAQATAAIRGLVFTPAPNHIPPPFTPVDNVLTITVTDDQGLDATGGTTVRTTPVNDAPTLGPGATVNLTPSIGTNEDTVSGPIDVASVVNATPGHGDADQGAVTGIAVTGVSKSVGGDWRYSTDGNTWVSFGAVSDGAALLLDGATLIEYAPDQKNGEIPSFTFRAWDETTGTPSDNITPGFANTTSTHSGGSTAFSSQTATATVTVTSVNDAPTITGALSTAQPVTDKTTITPFSTVTIGDVDFGSQPETVTVTLYDTATGALSGGGFTVNPDGSATLHAASAAAATAAIHGLTFTPAQNRGAVGSTETSTFTIAVFDGTDSANDSTTSVISTSVNDAPVVTSGDMFSLTGTNEDSPSAGVTVAAVLAGTPSYHDADSLYQPASGIAVTGVTKSTGGDWQYQAPSGSWTSFGAVTPGTALLLDAATQVRYVPDGKNAETASFAFRAWDETGVTPATTNAARHIGDTTVNGGTTPFSTNIAGASIAVSAVNDAPTLTGGTTATFSATDVTTASNSVTVTSLVSGAGYADIDTGPSTPGIAVTGTTGTAGGDWQYSTNGGGTWTNFGVVSGGGALLLDGASQVRFQPNNTTGGTAGFTFRGWDESTGTASVTGAPSTVDTSGANSGGTTAFSTATASGAVVLDDAPSLQDGATIGLTATNEDTTSGTTTVATLLNGASYADPDVGAVSGIAVTGVTKSTGGDWQYSVNGTTWTSFGTVTNGAALLLDGATQVRYVPDAKNAETASFSFRAWDETSGAPSADGARNVGNTSVNGHSSAFSTGVASATIAVTAVNDAPTLTNGATVHLTTTNEDTTSASTPVSTLLAGSGYADIDTGAVSGIAVTGVTKSAGGDWRYSTDGVTWTSFGTVSGTSALLLDSSTLVDYVPNGGSGETASFAFRAWDRSQGTASTNGARSTATTATTGGVTAFSANGASAAIVVTPVADTPSVTGATTLEDTQNASGLVITRNPSDGAEVPYFHITGITGGALYQHDGTSAIHNGDYITVAQGGAGLKFTPAANSDTSGQFQVQGSLSNASNGGGLGGGLATATIAVTPVADTPSVSDASAPRDGQSSSGLVISRNAADGAEVPYFKVTAVTGGTLYQADGVTPVHVNDFLPAAQGAAGLRFTPTAGSTTTGHVTVRASTSADDSGLGGAAVTASIAVAVPPPPPSAPAATDSTPAAGAATTTAASPPPPPPPAPVVAPAPELVTFVPPPPPPASPFGVERGTDGSRAASDMLHVGDQTGPSMPNGPAAMPGSLAPTTTLPAAVAPPPPLASVDRLAAESGGFDRGATVAALSARAAGGDGARSLQALAASGPISVASAGAVFGQMGAPDVVAAVRSSGLPGGAAVAAALSRIAGGEKMTPAEFQRFVAARGVGANAAKAYFAAYQRVSGEAKPAAAGAPPAPRPAAAARR